MGRLGHSVNMQHNGCWPGSVQSSLGRRGISVAWHAAIINPIQKTHRSSIHPIQSSQAKPTSSPCSVLFSTRPSISLQVHGQTRTCMRLRCRGNTGSACQLPLLLVIPSADACALVSPVLCTAPHSARLPPFLCTARAHRSRPRSPTPPNTETPLYCIGFAMPRTHRSSAARLRCNISLTSSYAASISRSICRLGRSTGRQIGQDARQCSNQPLHLQVGVTRRGGSMMQASAAVASLHKTRAAQHAERHVNYVNRVGSLPP